MVLALSALAVSFSFAGGDADAFAKSLSEATGKPVLMVSPTRQKFPAFEKTTETIRSLSNAVADAYDFQNGGMDDLGFCETSYPPSIIANWPDPVTKKPTKRQDPSAPTAARVYVHEFQADGRMTLSFPAVNGPTLAGIFATIYSASGGKALATHGTVIGKLRLAGFGKDVSRAEFLNCVASAIGARIEQSASVAKLIPEPSRFQARIAGAFRACIPQVDSATLRARYQLAADLTMALDDTAIADFAETARISVQPEGNRMPRVAAIATAWIRKNFQTLPEKARTALSRMSGPSSRPKFSIRLGLDECPRITVTDGTQTVEL